ncbi:hypothetical protein B296_00033985 [Ensete ventricosum]|uniref:Uncharacterized protein n=1 Tax=Ensete ventricosum TaxID=4639 RepID=A0A427A881_ENSVE|nr:hypothetical protein B296_00033985 [Ensete ventricosum]
MLYVRLGFDIAIIYLNFAGRRKLFTPEEKVLLNKRIPNLAEATSSKWLPLHSLAASGEFFLLDTLLKHNVDINGVDKDGLSAIHKAILCKKQAVINYLLRNSANPFIRDRHLWVRLNAPRHGRGVSWDDPELASIGKPCLGTIPTSSLWANNTSGVHVPSQLLAQAHPRLGAGPTDESSPLGPNRPFLASGHEVGTNWPLLTFIYYFLVIYAWPVAVIGLPMITLLYTDSFYQDGLTPLDLCLYSGHNSRTYELIKQLKQFPPWKSSA